MKSDKIDEYFTTDYDGKVANDLAKLMISLKNAYKKTEYTYTTILGDKIVATVSNNDIIYIETSEGRIYKYSFVGDYDNITIDGEYVYMNEARNNYQASSSTSSSSSATSVTDEDDLIMCWGLAKDVVRANLKSPSSAKFPFSYNSKDVTITKSGDIYTVKAWVEAENAFGATLRPDFTVKIVKSGSGKNAKFVSQSCYIAE